MATSKKNDPEYHKEYRRKNKESLRIKSQAYRAENREKRKLHRSSEAEKNKARALENNRYQNDMQFKLRKKWRATVARGLKLFGEDPSSKSLRYLVGCNAYELKRYIESLFKPGMKWGKIHVDHIIPCIDFDLTRWDQVLACFHYSNCQPLWPQENWDKWNSKERELYKNKKP